MNALIGILTPDGVLAARVLREPFLEGCGEHLHLILPDGTANQRVLNWIQAGDRKYAFTQPINPPKLYHNIEDFLNQEEEYKYIYQNQTWKVYFQKYTDLDLIEVL